MPGHSVVHFVRYLAHGRVRCGWLEGDALVVLDRPPWEGGRPTGQRDSLAGVELIAPVRPGKIVCVGLNYRAHIAESQSLVPGAEAPREPLIFLKPPSAVIGPGQPIRYPAGVTRLDPEAELGIVIGRHASCVSLAEARAAIAGLTCFNDLTARNFQREDGQWTRAKGFDTFAPLGPSVAVGIAAEDRGVECRVNGETRQRGNTADLLFPVPVLIAHISRIMTLEPGDVIATGTPAGVAPILPGDRVVVEVEGVGVLENRVEKAAS